MIPITWIRGTVLWIALLAPGLSDSASRTRSRAPGDSLTIPIVDILYPPGGSLLDRTLARSPQWAGDSLALRETVARRAEFQALWDREGTIYLRTALHLVGRPFPFRETQVVLTVSQLSSMSSPLLVNVRRFLSGADPAAPPEDFVEKVFHELMHLYTVRVRSSSALMAQYSSESPTVIYHLHVMALERLVLEKLGRRHELNYLDQLYRTDPPPGDYRRAWEIVNATGPEAFLRELRAMPR